MNKKRTGRTGWDPRRGDDFVTQNTQGKKREREGKEREFAGDGTMRVREDRMDKKDITSVD